MDFESLVLAFMKKVPGQLLDPMSPAVTVPAGVGGAPLLARIIERFAKP
jgi:hypothetical protein